MDAARQASLSITYSWSLFKLMSINSAMPSSLHPSHPRSLLLPSIFPSIRIFSSESGLLIKWPEYWSFSFSISLSSEYLGLIFLRMDWLDLSQSKGLQESSPTPQFKSINYWCAAFFMVQPSHLYMTTGKTRALTRWNLLTK